MDENEKKEVIDIIKSEEIRRYLEELLEKNNSSIIEYISKSHDKRVEEEIKQSKKKIKVEKEKRKELEDRISKLEKELNEKSIELENNNIEYKKKSSELRDYEEKYKVINEAFLCYHRLSENTKLRLSNIIRKDNIYSFITDICDWNSIEGMWTYVKTRIIEDELEEVDVLVKLFELSFGIFCLYDDSGKYKMISPNEGEHFDSDIHSIKGKKTDGIIKKVLLSGVQDTASQKAVFKAIVQV